MTEIHNREGGDDGEVEQGGNSLIYPSAMQNIVASVLTTASVTTSSQFPLANTSSTFPMTIFILANNLTDMMNTDPVLTANNHQLITIIDDAATSALGRKHKAPIIVHSTPGSIISAVHPVPSTFNTPLSLSLSSDPSLGTKDYKASLHGSSSSTRGYLLNSAKSSTHKSTHTNVSGQLAAFNNILHNMMSAMKTQNLIYQVTEVHPHVILAIQQDTSG